MTEREKSGAERIAAERRRQIDKEGLDEEHDDAHGGGELALVAALMASPVRLFARDYDELDGGVAFRDPWPWQDYEPRPHRRGKILPNDELTNRRRIRQLEKAGALIAAEIDRLLREEDALRRTEASDG